MRAGSYGYREVLELVFTISSGSRSSGSNDADDEPDGNREHAERI